MTPFTDTVPWLDELLPDVNEAEFCIGDGQGFAPLQEAWLNQLEPFNVVENADLTTSTEEFTRSQASGYENARPVRQHDKARQDLLLRKRKSQQRMREKRRHELAEIRSRVEQLTKRYQELAADNSKLKLRTRVLDFFVNHNSFRQHLVQRVKQPGTAVLNGSEINSEIAKRCLEYLHGEPCDILTLSCVTFIDRWKSLVLQLSAPLMNAQSPNHNAEAMEELHIVVPQLCWLAAGTMNIRPTFYMQVWCYNMEAMKMETPPASLWESIAKLLELTDQQRIQVSAAWEIHTAQMKALRADELDVCRQLQATAPGCENLSSVWSSSLNSHGFETVAERLHAILNKQINLRQQMSAFFMGGTLTMYQKALVAFHSYPFFPDPLCILAALMQNAHSQAKPI